MKSHLLRLLTLCGWRHNWPEWLTDLGRNVSWKSPCYMHTDATLETRVLRHFCINYSRQWYVTRTAPNALDLLAPISESRDSNMTVDIRWKKSNASVNHHRNINNNTSGVTRNNNKILVKFYVQMYIQLTLATILASEFQYWLTCSIKKEINIDGYGERQWSFVLGCQDQSTWCRRMPL